MVSSSPGDAPMQPHVNLAPGNPPCIHEVLVPVMLRVRVKGDDEFQAEVRALEIVNNMSIQLPPEISASVRIASVISPMVDNRVKPQSL
jgi:hypothetical protein